MKCVGLLTKGELMKILLVDDDLNLLKIINTLLAGAGHTVLMVGNGIQAQSALRFDTYDAVITDVQMPKASGLHVLGFMSKEEISTPTLIHSSESNFYGADIKKTIADSGWDFATFHHKRDERWEEYVPAFLEEIKAA